jgi:hypothetical protein
MTHLFKTGNHAVHSITLFFSTGVTQKARTILFKYARKAKVSKSPPLVFYPKYILALSLFVFWVLTDYSDASLSFNDFALLANRFY